MKSSDLAFQLRLAASACAAVRQGSALSAVLPTLFKNINDPKTRGAVQDLSYRTLRTRGTADALLQALAPRTPPTAIRELLIVALALLVQTDAYQEFTVVDQAVEAAGKQSAFVNAVLRRYLRERLTLLPNALRTDEARWNYPAWWIKHLRTAYPNHWQKILATGNAAPPMTLRINQRRTSREAYVQRLAQAGIGALLSNQADTAVVLTQPVPVTQLPGFAEGEVSVQDAAAQWAAPLLAAKPGSRVLDACAAPGGKAAHILECVDCDLLALDHDAQRLTRVDENFARLQLTGHTRVGDASQPQQWWDGREFDYVLADVPCTASGIVRRHADIRWLRREADIASLTTSARQMLHALWGVLKPGGTLLLATCSVFPEEGEQQAQNFLAQHADALLLPGPGQSLPNYDPEVHGGDPATHDGFFYALLQKRC